MLRRAVLGALQRKVTGFTGCPSGVPARSLLRAAARTVELETTGVRATRPVRILPLAEALDPLGLSRQPRPVLITHVFAVVRLVLRGGRAYKLTSGIG
jgi:hypothetical protein